MVGDDPPYCLRTPLKTALSNIILPNAVSITAQSQGFVIN